MKIYIVIVMLMAAIVTTYYYLSQKQQSIYVYNDLGASKESVMQTKEFLKNMTTKNYNIVDLSAKDLLEGSWVTDSALLVIPGGADIPYVKKLRGKGDGIIQKYIKQGGSFLGICAGAYYSSDSIEFDKGGKNEVIGERYLKLFAGKAIGPILADYTYSSNKGARAAKISCANKQLSVFYNGGPYFEMPANNNTTVICRYYEKNNLPAVLHSKYGKGLVLLSAVHFEYNPSTLDHNDPHYQSIIETLKKDTTEREEFGKKMLKLLAIKTK